MAAPVPHPLVERLLAFFFGRDIFVSYCYEDSAYAEALAVGLGERKFSVFLGAWGASPGRDISKRVASAARQSRLLVVVATPRSRASGPVEQEIAWFAQRGKPVVPIDFGLGMRSPKDEWPALAGTDVIRETGPTPSDAVFERIENAAKFMRQETRLRRLLVSVAIVVGVLIGGATWWTNRIVDDAEQHTLSSQEFAAKATRGLRRANGEKTTAEKLRDIAQHDKKIADELKLAADAAAKREAEIGAALRMANDATTIASQQPAQIFRASLMAADAVLRLHRHGVRVLAGDNAIRTTVGALPVIDARAPFVLAERGFRQTTPDARHILLRDGVTQRIEVIDTDSGSQVPLPLPGGISVVYGTAIAANGSRAAAVIGRKNEPASAIIIWRTDNGTVLRTIPLERGAGALALTDDGNTLAFSRAVDKTIVTEVMRVEDAQVLAQLRRPENTIERSLKFNPAGDVLVSLGGFPPVIWPWTEGEATFTAPPEVGPQQAFFNPAQRDLIAFQDRGLLIFRWTDWKLLWSMFEPVMGDAGAAAFSSDGEWIAGIAYQQVALAHWKTEATRTMLPLHDFGQFVAVENGSVAVGFRDGITELRSPLNDTAIRVAHHGEVVAVAMAPDGAVHSVGYDGALTWHAAPVDSRLSQAEVDDVASSRDGSVVVSVTSTAVGSRDHRLNVYRNGKSAGTCEGWKFNAVSFDAHDHFYAGTRDGQLLQWRSIDDVGKAQPEIVKDAQPPVVISPSGTYRLYATPAVRRKTAKGMKIVQTVILENVKSGQSIELPHLVGSHVMTFGSDDTIVTADAEGMIRVWKWRVDRTRPAAVFKAQPRVMVVAASRDDTWIAAGSREWPTMVWKVSAPDRPFATLERETAMIDFDPLQPSLITADRDGIARVWNLQERPVEIARFPASRWGMVARFSADGRYAITASSHDGVRVHLWRDEELASEACRRLKALRGTTDLAGYDSVCGLAR